MYGTFSGLLHLKQNVAVSPADLWSDNGVYGFPLKFQIPYCDRYKNLLNLMDSSLVFACCNQCWKNVAVFVRMGYDTW